MVALCIPDVCVRVWLLALFTRAYMSGVLKASNLKANQAPYLIPAPLPTLNQYRIVFYLYNTTQFKRLFGIFAIRTYIVP